MMSTNDSDIIKSLKGPILDIYRALTSEVVNGVLQISTNRLLEYQVKQKEKYLFSKTFFHRAIPINLYDYYWHLGLKLYHAGGINEPNQDFRTTNKIKDVFKDENKLAIIGTGGGGKSTLIKHLFVNCIESNFKYPIVIELRELNRENFKGDVLKYIYSEIFEFERLGISRCVSEKLLSKGGFLFIFDGFDEIDSGLVSAVKSEIAKFTSRFFNNLFILTSRPYSGAEYLSEFVNYQLCELPREDIPFFVKKLIPDKPQLAEKIVNEIFKPSNSSFLSFAKNPLLLSLFVLTFEDHPKLPKKKVTYYEKVFQTLYETHNSISKNSHESPIESGLIEEQIREILNLFSFVSYFQEKYEFDRGYTFKIFKEIKDSNEQLVFDTSLLLKDLTKSLCILTVEGDYYEFMHRSLQEYFAVNYIDSLSYVDQIEACNFILGNIEQHYNLVELLSELLPHLFIKQILKKYISICVSRIGEFVDYPGFGSDKALTAFNFLQYLFDLLPKTSELFEQFLLDTDALVDRKKRLYSDLKNYSDVHRDKIIGILKLDNNYTLLEKKVDNLLTEDKEVANQILKLANIKGKYGNK